MELSSSDISRLVHQHLHKHGYVESANTLITECPHLFSFKPVQALDKVPRIIGPSLVHFLEAYIETKDMIIEELKSLNSTAYNSEDSLPTLFKCYKHLKLSVQFGSINDNFSQSQHHFDLLSQVYVSGTQADSTPESIEAGINRDNLSISAETPSSVDHNTKTFTRPSSSYIDQSKITPEHTLFDGQHEALQCAVVLQSLQSASIMPTSLQPAQTSTIIINDSSLMNPLNTYTNSVTGSADDITMDLSIAETPSIVEHLMPSSSVNQPTINIKCTQSDVHHETRAVDVIKKVTQPKLLKTKCLLLQRPRNPNYAKICKGQGPRPQPSESNRRANVRTQPKSRTILKSSTTAPGLCQTIEPSGSVLEQEAASVEVLKSPTPAARQVSPVTQHQSHVTKGDENYVIKYQKDELSIPANHSCDDVVASSSSYVPFSKSVELGNAVVPPVKLEEMFSWETGSGRKRRRWK